MRQVAGAPIDDVARPDWRPEEFGLGRAVLMAGAAVAVLLAGAVMLAGRVAPPVSPPPVVVRLVEPSAAASSVAATLPEVTPAEIAPPAPTVAPAMAPEAALVPSPIEAELVVPPSPENVAPTVSKPVAPKPRQVAQRPLARPEPAETLARPTTTANDAPVIARAPPDTSSGLGPYSAALHRRIERNMLDDSVAQRLGASGTALIEASIAPSGQVLAARIARSSGNRAIDAAALSAVQRGGFAPFGPHMPGTPITIAVPIGVEAE